MSFFCNFFNPTHLKLLRKAQHFARRLEVIVFYDELSSPLLARELHSVTLFQRPGRGLISSIISAGFGGKQKPLDTFPYMPSCFNSAKNVVPQKGGPEGKSKSEIQVFHPLILDATFFLTYYDVWCYCWQGIIADRGRMS